MENTASMRTVVQALLLVAVVCLCAGIASAGSFSSGDEIGSPLPAGATLYGDATWHDRAFWLTHNVQTQQGAVILHDLDPGMWVTSFWMEAMLYIGNGDTTGADGLSFCFGDLPEADFGEKGAGTGLRVMLDTFDNWDDPNDHCCRIRVTYGNDLVAESELIDLRPLISEEVWNEEYGHYEVTHEPQWFGLAVGVEDTGEVIVLQNLNPGFPGGWYTEAAGEIEGWDPQPNWRFGFGARTGSYADWHGVWDVTIETTAVPEPGAIVLLALGGVALLRRRPTA